MSTEKTQVVPFPHLLQQFLPEIKRALPKHMDGDRMARIALTEFRKNPKLGDCDPKSVFASLIIGSQLGLEPGIMGQSFLVPYKRTCQFVPGWQGLNDLVARAGRATTWTGAVREGDEFDYQLGDSPYIRHRPNDGDEETPLLFVYAVGRVRGSDWPIIEVWSLKKVLRHRDKHNKVGDRHYSYDNIEMYARKVPLLQVIKYLPKSVELSTAVALDHAASQGDQGLTIKDAIEGTWTPESPALSEIPNDERAAINKPQAKSAQPTSASSPTNEVKKPEVPIAQSTPLGDSIVEVLKAKLDASALSQADLFRHFKVERWNQLETGDLDRIRAWIGNPNG